MEYLQAGLYTEAERLGELRPKSARLGARRRRARARARAGSQEPPLFWLQDRPEPRTFNYRGVTSNRAGLHRTAVAFEDLTAALLKWQAVRLDSRSIVTAAVTLHCSKPGMRPGSDT